MLGEQEVDPLLFESLSIGHDMTTDGVAIASLQLIQHRQELGDVVRAGKIDEVDVFGHDRRALQDGGKPSHQDDVGFVFRESLENLEELRAVLHF